MKKEAQKIIQKIKKEQDKLKILASVNDKLEKERTMELSIKEGSSASVMSGMGTDYVTPFALTLGANNAQIGFLSSIPGLISPLMQIVGSRIMEKHQRKKIIFLFVMLQALMWIPLALLSILFWRDILVNYLPMLLILFYTLLAVFGALAGPSWFSLMGDLIPEKLRGRYFSSRSRVSSSFALSATILASFILDFFKTRGLILAGFSFIFFIACISRLISASMFRKHYDPQFNLEQGYYFTFWSFLKRIPSDNFGRFAIFIALMNFAVSIAGPFFSVYMLKDLGFSYKTFMLVNISASIFSLIFIQILGKFSDKYGNIKLIKYSSILVSTIPIMWIFSKSPIYFMLVPQLIGGIGWAGFNLASSNFIYDSVSVQRRGLCIAYYNVLVGIGVFLGAGIGGFLAQYLTISFINRLLFIFIISGILRATISLLLLRKIKEVKKVRSLKSQMLYFKEINPVKGVYMEITNNIRLLKRGASYLYFNE